MKLRVVLKRHVVECKKCGRRIATGENYYQQARATRTKGRYCVACHARIWQ